ncbi:MAG: hypothetical protein Q8T13_13720 [Acidobacteriota bacterium]|nr:hypothetical protein [Acidobacteriota bacterium]
MPSTIAATVASTHRLNSEIGSPRMAKADLKKIDQGLRHDIGRCVARARQSLSWSQKELADAIERGTGEARDVAQLSRWEAGTERPQFDVLFSVPEFQQPLVIALAGLTGAFEIVTELRARRMA